MAQNNLSRKQLYEFTFQISESDAAIKKRNNADASTNTLHTTRIFHRPSNSHQLNQPYRKKSHSSYYYEVTLLVHAVGINGQCKC